ncbi:MAG: hypothetical protein GY711_02845 [bacterium]|nr:hypothetical protein [bacterium]
MLRLETLAAAYLVVATNADILCLKDGRFLEKELARCDGGVVVQFENGEVFVPEAMILEAVIEGAEIEPATQTEREQIAKGLVRYGGRWVRPERRAELIRELIAERRTAMEELRAHRLWRNRYKETTKHFAFEHTIPPNAFAGYRDAMEAYFQDFVKTWRIKLPRKLGPVRVGFHADRESFEQISGASGGTVGFFRFVEPFELNFYFDRRDPRYTEEVMFHETNHYLQKLFELSFHYPHWPGESLAEYYGASVWDPEKEELTTGLAQEGRLAQIERDIAAGKMWGIEELILDERAFEHYTWGWSLVHFLMHHPKHKKRFQKFYVDLARSKKVERYLTGGADPLWTCTQEEVLRVFKVSLRVEKRGLKELEREWHVHVQDLLDNLTVRGLEKAAMQAYWADRPIRARRLFEEAIEAGSEQPLVHLRYGYLLYRDDAFGAAGKAVRQGLEHDPLDPYSYLLLGRILRAKGERDPARKSVQLALELDPDDAWLEESARKLLESIEEQ